MKKLQMLRDHLLSALPTLAANPDRLLTFIEDGNLRYYRGPTLAHEYQCPVRITILDYTGDLDAVIIPMLAWLERYQPEIEPENGIRIEAEILSNAAWDIAITVNLTERVVTRIDCETGRIEADHRVPEFPQDSCPPQSWELYVKDPATDTYELAASWESPTPEAPIE
jgi:hypothetical protein